MVKKTVKNTSTPSDISEIVFNDSSLLSIYVSNTNLNDDTIIAIKIIVSNLSCFTTL